MTPFSVGFSVSTLDHVAVSPLLSWNRTKVTENFATRFCKRAEITGTILPHQTVCCACLSFRLLGEQWCSIRLTAPRTTWLPPSNRGSITKQERSAERRAQLPGRAVRSCAPIAAKQGGLHSHFRAYLWGFRIEKKMWARSGRLKQIIIPSILIWVSLNFS